MSTFYDIHQKPDRRHPSTSTERSYAENYPTYITYDILDPFYCDSRINEETMRRRLNSLGS